MTDLCWGGARTSQFSENGNNDADGVGMDIASKQYLMEIDRKHDEVVINKMYLAVLMVAPLDSQFCLEKYLYRLKRE